MYGMTTTTPNLPAVIEARTPAVRELAVGTHVRIVSQEDPAIDLGIVGALGVVTEHRPQRVVNNPPAFPFTALEDFVVALWHGDDIVEFCFTRDELEVI